MKSKRPSPPAPTEPDQGDGAKNNMLLLVEHGIRKFATGITAIKEVTRVMSQEKSVASGKTGILPAAR